MKKEEKITQTKKEIVLEMVRFILFGGIVTVVDYLTFYLFRQWVLSPEYFASGAWNVFSLVVSTALGFTVGLCVSWVFSVRFVFRAVKDKEKASSKRGFFLFAVIGVFGLFITLIGMHIGVLILPDFPLFGVWELFSLPMKEWVTKAVMTVVVLIFNYFARKRWVFPS